MRFSLENHRQRTRAGEYAAERNIEDLIRYSVRDTAVR